MFVGIGSHACLLGVAYGQVCFLGTSRVCNDSRGYVSIGGLNRYRQPALMPGMGPIKGGSWGCQLNNIRLLYVGSFGSATALRL